MVAQVVMVRAGLALMGAVQLLFGLGLGLLALRGFWDDLAGWYLWKIMVPFDLAHHTLIFAVAASAACAGFALVRRSVFARRWEAAYLCVCVVVGLIVYWVDLSDLDSGRLEPIAVYLCLGVAALPYFPIVVLPDWAGAFSKRPKPAVDQSE
jgi:hypothetical protein